MAILYKTEIGKVQLFIWENEAGVQQFQDIKGVNLLDLKEFQSIKHAQRQHTFLNSRALIYSLFKPSEIRKNSHGAFAPTPKGHHLSLSHTHDYSVLAVSTNPVGVDIETQRPEIAKIWHKFAHHQEQKFNADWERLLLWTCKEALFKRAEKDLNFKEEICVESYTGSGKGIIEGKVKDKPFVGHFIQVKDHLLTVCS